MTLSKIGAWLLAGAAMSVATMAHPQAASQSGLRGSLQASAPVARPWMNTALSADRRADLLLGQMTWDEKIALLHGKVAFRFGPATVPPGAIGSSGYVPGIERLGIPALQESDASMGIANTLLVRGPDDMSTALPSALALAATFDPAIAFSGGAMIGNEARAKTINVQLAGGVNLARDPRNGRNFEYVGEDPLLGGVLAGEVVRGIQSEGVLSTVKHFALNGQEHNRQTANSVIGESAARESDLLAFQIAIERGKPGAVMCGYNLANGVHTCQDPWLLDKVLKRDWRYPGFVMSDWGAVHGVEALAAGLDQESGAELDEKVWFDAPLKAAVGQGQMPSAKVDSAARRILSAMFAAGLFDRPSGKSEIDWEAHARIAQREAENGIVLLENRKNILPLAASARKIAVIGGHAEAGVPSGMGSSQVSTPYQPSPKRPLVSVPVGGEGIMSVFGNVVFHPSSPLLALRARLKQAVVSFDNGFYPSAAADAARKADVAIVFVYQPSGEGEDVPSLALPMGQDALVEAVAAANPNTIVVVESGNPVTMPWADKVGAIVEAWYGGSRGGEAIADVLTGVVNPSGRLPITWPRDETQLPRPAIPGWGEAPRAPVDVDYRIEGSDVGYRWYARQGLQPSYWFGHGLSYTSFGYSQLSVAGGKGLSVQVTVANTGKQAGQELVQLYLSARNGKPSRRLLAFEKISLAPGETRRVALKVDARLLADFDTGKGQWAIPSGRYDVAIGRDAGDALLTGAVRIQGFALKP